MGLLPFVTEGNKTNVEGLFFYRLKEKLWKLHQQKMGNLYARNELHSERGTELAITECLALPGSSVMEHESCRTFSSVLL